MGLEEFLGVESFQLEGRCHEVVGHRELLTSDVNFFNSLYSAKLVLLRLSFHFFKDRFFELLTLKHCLLISSKIRMCGSPFSDDFWIRNDDGYEIVLKRISMDKNLSNQ